jgi:hypothetical protein
LLPSQFQSRRSIFASLTVNVASLTCEDTYTRLLQYIHTLTPNLHLDVTMSKRERPQLPESPRKRQTPSRPMNTDTSPTSSLSEDTGLESLRAPSVQSSYSSQASRSTTVSTEASQRSSPFQQKESSERLRSMAASRSGITDTRPVIAKRLSSHFQIPLAASSGDSSENIDQNSMATAGPPSPVSFKESTPNLIPTQTRPKDPVSPCQFGDTCISTRLRIPQQ